MKNFGFFNVVVLLVISIALVLSSVGVYIFQKDGLGIACTQDAMQCPDGSYVGRTGPNCEFHCPAETSCKSGVCQKSTSTVDTATWKTYRDNKYGFEIRYPNDWYYSTFGDGAVWLFKVLYEKPPEEYKNSYCSHGVGCNFPNTSGVVVGIYDDRQTSEDLKSFAIRRTEVSPDAQFTEKYFKDKKAIDASETGYLNYSGKGIYIELDPTHVLAITAFNSDESSFDRPSTGVERERAHSTYQKMLSTFKFFKPNPSTGSGQATGTLSGKMTIGPICPVERNPPDPKCKPTAEMFALKTIVVLPYGLAEFDAGRTGGQVHPDANGNFSLSLEPGVYTINVLPWQKGLGSVSIKPDRFAISAGGVVNVAIDIDTGIR